jgi:hypothetical protein
VPLPYHLQALQKHRQFVRVDFYAQGIRRHACRELEATALETLMHNRVAAPRPQQHLHLCPPAINENEDVS